jgi:hypothetical protein
MKRKATKKIFAPKPKAPKAPNMPAPKSPILATAEARIQKWIDQFLSTYPPRAREEIARLIEDRARHWRLENEIAQLKNP